MFRLALGEFNVTYGALSGRIRLKVGVAPRVTFGVASGRVWGTFLTPSEGIKEGIKTTSGVADADSRTSDYVYMLPTHITFSTPDAILL